jgi:hypothetical protein
MSGQNPFYTVKKNDTLWNIAKANGTTVEELKKINGMKNADRIAVGQRIALRREAVCGVEALFLDRGRNPIKGLPYRIEQCGKVHQGITAENGKSKQRFTETPDDPVTIWVKRLDGTWKRVTTVVSGFGNKLITLISGHAVVEGRTEKHPELPSGALPDRHEKPKPKYPIGKAPAPTVNKKELGKKTTSTKTPDGKPLTVVEGDIPELDFLGGYTGEKITDADYEAAAKDLGCEVEVIKSIAKQETGKLETLGLGAFDKSNRPTILYERHIFSRVTAGAHDAKHPDLSNAKEYLAGTAKNKDGQKYDDGEHYGLFSWQYKKLAKAAQLDKEAAIQACSWGKFQVLGTNYQLCGFASAVAFAKAMCKSEKEHLNVMVSFCKGNKLEAALKSRNWQAIAKTYNGPKYKKNKYDTELEAHYNAFKKVTEK